MKLLLDTHAFIWWDSNAMQLSPSARAALCDPANEVWLSVVSVWEMVIKSQLGKLTTRLPLAEIIIEQQSNGLQIRPVALSHVLAVETPADPQGSLRPSPRGAGKYRWCRTGLRGSGSMPVSGTHSLVMGPRNPKLLEVTSTNPNS